LAPAKLLILKFYEVKLHANKSFRGFEAEPSLSEYEEEAAWLPPKEGVDGPKGANRKFATEGQAPSLPYFCRRHLWHFH